MRNENTGLKPQDCLILVKILLSPHTLSQKEIAAQTFISEAEVSFSIRRIKKSYLMLSGGLIPRYADCAEFLIHAVKYIFPVYSKGMSVGIPTAHSNPNFDFVNSRDEIPYIWSYADDLHITNTKEIKNKIKLVKGETVVPIYKTVPMASLIDVDLYEFFSLLDMLRLGRAREKKIAVQEITKILKESSRKKNEQHPPS